MATTGGVDSGDIRDLMIESLEACFGPVNSSPAPLEWLSDNGTRHALHRARDACAGPRDRLRTTDHANRKPAIH